ncbi:Spase12 [Drosophila busckii]|uniref:Signal peptidase complex subunit 1 n=1 Tax=Drosophila busckii TaxID=30019 RepID=A0A0M4ENC6_DROBS|nr:signal peptidase complex subunit 1 [Drosophila busckii]ALC46176.1 Spase12 [Drosophila busckii]
MLDIQTHMDFVGQAKAERWSRLIITVFGVIGLIYGAVVQQFSQTVYVLGVGFLLSALITIPPWPIYRRNPMKWQKPVLTDQKTKDPKTKDQKTKTSDSSDEKEKKKKK